MGWKTFAFVPLRLCSEQLKQWLEIEQLPKRSLSHFTSRVEVEFETLPVWLKHNKAEHGFSKRFSNSLFLSPSVFQNRIASATLRPFKDTFIYVHLNLTLGLKSVTEQSTESMMLLAMSLHARGSQSIFQLFQAVVTDFTKATAWKAAQTTLVFLDLQTCYQNLQRTSKWILSSFHPSFPINRLVQGALSLFALLALQV